MIAGSVFLGIGIIGIVVPVLPTTPFLILAAICYARGSAGCYRWLVTNRVFGRHLDDYLHGRGVSWKVKSGALALLWGVITVTAVLLVSALWLRILLFVIAVGVTLHLVMLKGRGRGV
ncbi:MAG: YbaN family protein [Thermoleophilia bacterium]|nr:YbaN family protein [Thermoleophilia bacterium]